MAVKRLKRRAVTHRKPRPIKSLEQYANDIIRVCDQIFAAADQLDTAVRDDVSTGLAYLLYSAYDSQAVNLGLEGAAFEQFPGNCTAEWFRSRGFAEWFCNAAANLFRTSRPRIFSFETRKRTGKKVTVIRWKESA